MVVLIGTAAAAAIDVRTRRIPNALSAAIAGCGGALAVVGASGISVAASGLGLLVGLLLMLPGHALGGTGTGDVKLMGAVGAVIGPAHVLAAFLFAAIAGGAIAIVVAARRGRLTATLGGAGRLITSPVRAGRVIAAPGADNRFPYGPAIAIGSVFAALL